MRPATGLAAAAIAALIATAAPTTATSAPAAQRPDHAAAAVKALKAHPGAARATEGQGFVVRDTLVDRNGRSHVRLDRTLDGLRVLGGDLVVHQEADLDWDGVSQTLAAPLELSTKAKIKAASAEAKALAPNKLNRGIAKDKDGEVRSELVVDATTATPRLAWEVTTAGVQKDGTPSRLATYVDASTGALIRAVQGIHTADGSGETLYSGTVPLQLTLGSGTYSLKDPTRGNTYTNNLNGSSDSIFCTIFGWFCPTGTTFTSSDSVFDSATEKAGVDAQYGTNTTWDYFKGVHGRNGIFGDGRGSWNRVHYGSGYVNAFWDGTKMTYGDGDGVNFGPLVSLDVAGHEMTHGVTENSANLTYAGESGGLNESTSDIFGSLVEFHAANANDPADYFIGEEFDLKNNVGFRRMDTPSGDGKSVDCWYSGVGNVDVHYSSGVGNHFFYLLAEGSGTKQIGGRDHTSATCNGSTIAGIGREKAGKIWYRALTVYMTSSTNYAGARVASLKAAADLYGGTGSPEYAAVAAAWSAVSVN